MRTKFKFEPDYANHPGETLGETLVELGMSQAKLAQRTGRPLKTINQLILGRTRITARTAIQLERAIGVPASFWNNAQRNFDAFVAGQEESIEFESSIDWMKKFPLIDLYKLCWLEKSHNEVETLKQLLNFFGVVGKKEWEAIWLEPKAAFRNSMAFETQPMAVACWLRYGEQMAQQMKCKKYIRDRFKDALLEIRKLTRTPPRIFQPKMTKLCADSGVAVVFVPEVPGTRTYGATRWLNSHRAILQLSLRGKYNDLFWFTFFHEAAHILKHRKSDIFIESQSSMADKSMKREEIEANNFSTNFLISKNDFKYFDNQGVIKETPVRRFASKLNIAPGIVVGRLQYEGIIKFNQLNHLKERFHFR